MVTPENYFCVVVVNVYTLLLNYFMLLFVLYICNVYFILNGFLLCLSVRKCMLVYLCNYPREEELKLVS